MGIKKNILIIGFEKEPISYPHMKYVVDYFVKNYNADYYYSSERGYFLGTYEKIDIKNLFRLIIKTLLILKDFLFLLNRRRKYSIIIAVDNFSYILSSMLFKRTILWSHDFVTKDQEHARSIIQRAIARFTKFYLGKNKSLIIQDNDRLELFLNTYEIEQPIDVFYLPVSLPALDLVKRAYCTEIKPVLMQIGGINKFRSGSDRIIQYYQDNYSKMDLILHGFFDDQIKKLLTESKKIPICSTLPLPASDVYKLVELTDIGFVSYETQNLNFYYIAHASGQLVEFIRLSKPIIAYGNTNLGDFINQHELGVGIKDIKELGGAMDKIKANYDYYCKNCEKYFQNHLDLNIYLARMPSWLGYK